MADEPDEPLPLVVEVQLLDEDERLLAEGIGNRAPSGQAIFSEIERQLHDSNSHLRRKSAFGALISRGAHLTCLANETCEVDEVGIVRPTCSRGLGYEDPAPTNTENGDVYMKSEKSPTESATQTVNAISTPTRGDASPSDHCDPPPLIQKTGNNELKGVATVPKILDFPRPPARPTVVPNHSLDYLSSFLGWFPFCSTTSCRSVPKQAMDACTILIPESEHLASCLKAPKMADGSTPYVNEPSTSDWPLCVSQAYAAVSAQQLAGGEPVSRSASSAPSLAASSRSASAGANFDTYLFRMVAVEVDDFDLTVLFMPQRENHMERLCQSPGESKETVDPTLCGSGKDQRVQATASTRAPSTIGQNQAWPPEWVKHNRLVLSREGILSFQVWPTTAAGRCMSPEQMLPSSANPPPWPHLVEVSGTPAGAPQAFSILLAFPSPSLASKVAEALSRVRKKYAGPATSKTTRGAVRCELRINAQLDLDGGVNAVNCATVIRRGISEACHVGADRVRICSVRTAEMFMG